MVCRNDDLFGVETKFLGGFLDRINRGSVHIGLTSFAQASITGVHAKAFEHTLERSGPAIHIRGLNHFRDQELGAYSHRDFGPLPRFVSESSSARAGVICLSGCE